MGEIPGVKFSSLEKEKDMGREAIVVIGINELTQAQSAALRVAVSSMLTDLQDPECRQALGEIAVEYEDRLKEIEQMFIRSNEQTSGIGRRPVSPCFD